MKKSLFCLSLLLAASSSHAIGPRDVTDGGTAVKWAGGAVNVDVEQDVVVGSKNVSTLIDDALDAWDDLTQAELSITRRTLAADIDNTNVCDYLYASSACTTAPQNNGVNPLIIDEDGSITCRFFCDAAGARAQYIYLGFALISISNSTTGAAVKGGAVFNAACLSGQLESGCSTNHISGFSDDDFTSFMVHEMGHFLGLDHSQVNRTEAENGLSADDSLINTMFPTFITGNGANFKTPNTDDIAGIAQLYPSASFTSGTWSLSGVLYNTDGTTGIQCGNIVARNTLTSRIDAISALSGDFAEPGVTDGTFRLVGLTPGASYTLDVEAIGSAYRGASGYTPCRGSNGESAPPLAAALPSFTSTVSFTGSAASTVFASCTRAASGGDCVQTSSLGGNGASGSGGGGTGGTADSAGGASCALWPE